MSHLSVKPLDSNEQEIVDSLENLAISATNEAIQKTGPGTFANKEFGTGSAVWGSITGTLSNQTDLHNALDAKKDEKVKYDTNDAAAGYLGDKTVAGTGISLAEGTGGDADKLKITNSAPDQTVSISAGTNIDSVTGTYPDFTINASTQTGSDEKVKYDASDPTAGYLADKVIAGNGISVAEGTGGDDNKFVITNEITDTADLTNGAGFIDGSGVSANETDPVFTAWLGSTPPAYPGDIPTSVDDLSPSQTGENGKFLTTDGTNASWASIPSGGDMLAATYDPASGAKQVAFADDLASYVPYSGATDNLNLGANYGLYGSFTQPVDGDEDTVGYDFNLKGGQGGTLNVETGTNGGNLFLFGGQAVGDGTNGWVGIIDPTTSIGATFDVTGITTASKKFTFPDTAGTIALTSDLTSFITDISGQDLSTADNSTSQFITAGDIPAETDPVVGAINGIIKADGNGNISRAMEFIDYNPGMDFASLAVNAWQPATEYEYLDVIYTGISNISPAWGNYGIIYFCCKENHTSSADFALDLDKWSFVFLNANTIAYIGGIAKSDGAGNLSQAISGTDYQAPLTFGIANTNAVEIDAADVADDDFARFTANGLEGRSAAEVLSDIGAAPALGADDNYVTDAEKAALHSQNTDTGTTGNTFTIDSDSTTGKIILDVALNAGEDHTMTITNAAMTEDVTITLPATTGTLVTGGGTASGTNTGDQDLSGLVPKATYDAHTILYATTDNTPVALTVTEQTVVGRATGGNISAIAIDSDLSSVSASDDTIPSAKATKTALDLKAPLASPTFTGTITLADNTRIDLTLPTADTYCTGPTTDSFASGYTAAAGDLVFFGSGGKWLEVDADAVATCKGLLGIALEAKNDTQAMKVALPGSMVRFDAWNWTVGATLYAGETLGAMQEAIPTGADAIIKVVGFALNADTIYFNPSPDQQSTVA